MNEEKCENCRFYKTDHKVIKDENKGFCLRYPPGIKVINHDCETGKGCQLSFNPIISNDHWCGEWQENHKIKNELLNSKYEESFKLHNEYWDALVKSKKLFLEDFKFNKINKCDHIAEENNLINLSYDERKFKKCIKCKEFYQV